MCKLGVKIKDACQSFLLSSGAWYSIPLGQIVAGLSLFGIVAAVVPPNDQSSAVVNEGRVGVIRVYIINTYFNGKKYRRESFSFLFLTLADEKNPETFYDSASD